MQPKAKQELNKREGLASGRLSECLSETWPDPKSEKPKKHIPGHEWAGATVNAPR